LNAVACHCPFAAGIALYICPRAAKSSRDKFCGTGYLESGEIYSNVKIRYLIFLQNYELRDSA